MRPAVTGGKGRLRRSAALLLGSAVVAALALTGCSGSGTASSSASPTSAATSLTGVQGVVDAANAFLATLSDEEKAKVLLTFDNANATAWSNLPCGSSCRVGIQLATLDDTKLAAAESVGQAALGSGADTGYKQVLELLAADDYLGAAQSSGTGGGPGAPASGGTQPSGGPPSGAAPSGSGGPPSGAAPSGSGGPGGGTGSGYSSGNYFLAFLGTPAMTGTWQLHFGGHHLAVNVTYKDGKVAGATPFFVGVEPTSWTATDGTKHAPLDVMKNGMLAMLSGLSTDELAKAKLSQSYTDVLLGPGSDGKFPETKSGIRVGDLSADKQALVLTAMRPWVGIIDDTTSANLMSTYQSELADTYVSYSGGTGLTAHGDYVRIDGPSVWVEFVCQNGVVFSDQIHYHTIYRDHTRDYGGELSF